LRLPHGLGRVACAAAMRGEQGNQSLAQVFQLALANLKFRPTQRLVKTRVVKGLQQVIKSVELKSLQRLLVEGGYKNDRRKPLRFDTLQHSKAIEFRHLYIEKNKIGRVLLYQRQGLAPVSGFTNNFDLRIVFE